MKVQRIGKKEEQVKAKRFTCGELENYPTDPDWIMATDADCLEAAISRKDAALHRCVDAMRGAQSQNWIGSANWKAWEDIIAVAKAALEET